MYDDLFNNYDNSFLHIFGAPSWSFFYDSYVLFNFMYILIDSSS